MREENRTIVAAIVFSKDGKVLMGRKDPKKGGVYADCWHIPGGSVREGESFEEALRREMLEETGFDIEKARVVTIENVGYGSAERVSKETGEPVLSHMTFNRFEVHIDTRAEEIALVPGDDLVELRWFSREELSTVKQIPGGEEFFKKMGYMD